MTTIAFDGQILASDRMSITGNRITSTATKLYGPFSLNEKTRQELRITFDQDDTFYYAGIGNVHDILSGYDYLADGAPKPKTEGPKNILAYLLSIKLGVLYLVHGDGLIACIEEYPCAIGSGSEMALGAMLAGKTASEAIILIASRSTGSGNGVDYFTLPDDVVKQREIFFSEYLGAGRAKTNP